MNGRHFTLDPLRRLDAARGRQRQVEQHDVRAHLDSKRERVAAVFGFADDVEVGLAFQDLAHPDPEQGVVVDQQDLGPLIGVSAVRAAPSAVGALVVGCHVHVLCFSLCVCERVFVELDVDGQPHERAVGRCACD
jgi:hypothetical protein